MNKFEEHRLHSLNVNENRDFTDTGKVIRVIDQLHTKDFDKTFVVLWRINNFYYVGKNRNDITAYGYFGPSQFIFIKETNLDNKHIILMQNLSFLFQELTKRNHALEDYHETKDPVIKEYLKNNFIEAEQNIKQVLGL